MTDVEFNKKWEAYLPEGWYGLDIGIEDVVVVLDRIFEDVTRIPGFEYHQIKLKFWQARCYTTLGNMMNYLIEQEINRIIGVL